MLRVCSFVKNPEKLLLVFLVLLKNVKRGKEVLRYVGHMNSLYSPSASSWVSKRPASLSEESSVCLSSRFRMLFECAAVVGIR